MGIISVKGIECYSYHGCLPEEGVIGQRYTVDVKFTLALKKASQSDNLTDTIDYCRVYKLVMEQMAIRSKLIEHVAGRIIDSLQKTFPEATDIEVTVTKFNPPVNGNIHHVSVTSSSK